MKKLEEYVRSIPDLPEPGITFWNVTSTLQDADGLHMAVDSLIDTVKDLGYDLVIGLESRGSIFGVPVAYAQHRGFVLVRKKRKFPCETIAMEYDLEYGQAIIGMHKDAICPGQKVIIMDDLITMGGTTEAIAELIEQSGGQVVKTCSVMELAGLNGREHLKGYDVDSAIVHEDKQENEIDLVTERPRQSKNGPFCYIRGESESVEDLINRADRAMYGVKRMEKTGLPSMTSLTRQGRYRACQKTAFRLGPAFFQAPPASLHKKNYDVS